MELVRLFIAIELPDAVKTALTRLQARLKSGKPLPVKWVNPHSIHLTLKFLGNVNSDRFGEVTEALETAARGISPFHLEVKGLGVFPSIKRVQVAWVGLTGETKRLGQLQQRIELNLIPLGFPPESRSFTPHLTLARVRDHALPIERQNFGQLIAETRFETAHNFGVNCVNLMKSQLAREGAIYSRISSVELK